MHYLDEYIIEQTERNILSGYKKTVTLEFINNFRASESDNNKIYAFKTYDDPMAQQVLEIVVSNILEGKMDTAYKYFMNLSREVKEVAGKPEIIQKFWELLLMNAQNPDE
jgi:hypothetical protein